MPVSPARAAAFEVLLRIENTDAYASELLHSSRFAKLSPADHGLLTELVMGVLRWRSVLDKTLAAHSSQPVAKLDLEVLTALRLGAHQLIFLDRIPAHAAINESVELVKRAHKRSAAGFVNAVLRKIAKNTPKPASFDDCSAHSDWLVDRWRQNYGSGAARKICEYDQTPPPPVLRITDPAVIDELKAEGVRLQPGMFLAHAFQVNAGDITRTKTFRERRLALQDEASQLVALLAGKGTAILDCCAAPGGKTRIIAERNPEAAVIAMELHPHRARLLRKLVPDSHVRVVAGDVRAMPLGKNFARILVDAPCSGTGTLARNPEIKWRLKLEDLLRLQAYQLEILSAAMKHVAPGGRLVYSTCSLEPEENEQVVEEALANDHSFAVVNCREELQDLQASGELEYKEFESLLSGPYLRTIPGVLRCDGFFAAILEKSEGTPGFSPG
jgi:16S rRNA (cytosine967-C5)-methyltransferase